jgi:GT2 family glycosyltransferase
VILAMTPFAPDKNLGKAYNEAMALLPADGWMIALDHDAALTTRDWRHQVAEAIAFRPDAGAFVACANRIGAFWQKAGNPDSHDMAEHRRFGAERLKVRTLLDVTDTMGFGGVAFATSKRAWEKAGGFVDGMLCVDHMYHFALRRAGLRVYLLEGWYVYHWRRAFGDDPSREWPRAQKCPCRGPEKEPKVRLQLP